MIAGIGLELSVSIDRAQYDSESNRNQKLSIECQRKRFRTEGLEEIILEVQELIPTHRNQENKVKKQENLNSITIELHSLRQLESLTRINRSFLEI